MGIFESIILIISLGVLVFLYVKLYKKELHKAEEKEKHLKSIESRLACTEQRLYELENSFENYMKGV